MKKVIIGFLIGVVLLVIYNYPFTSFVIGAVILCGALIMQRGMKITKRKKKN